MVTAIMDNSDSFISEVLTIKVVLSIHGQSAETLIRSLSRLHSMEDITVEILHFTQIGTYVSVLKKHQDEGARNLARKLLRLWKNVVDRWVEAGGSLESIKHLPHCSRERWPDCPPLADEEAHQEDARKRQKLEVPDSLNKSKPVSQQPDSQKTAPRFKRNKIRYNIRW